MSLYSILQQFIQTLISFYHTYWVNCNTTNIYLATSHTAGSRCSSSFVWFIRYADALSCWKKIFQKVVSQQYIGEAGKSIIVLLQINSVYHAPNNRNKWSVFVETPAKWKRVTSFFWPQCRCINVLKIACKIILWV